MFIVRKLALRSDICLYTILDLQDLLHYFAKTIQHYVYMIFYLL
jgi:hypothetical protein